MSNKDLKQSHYFKPFNFRGLRLRRQQGFLIPVALFILVVMGGLAVSITRMGTFNQVVPLQEHLSIQAYFSASTGAEFALHNIYFLPPQSGNADPDVIDFSHVQAVCKGLDNVHDGKSLGTAILLPANSCSATVYCKDLCVPSTVNAPQKNSLSLTITSSGFCGIKGQVWAERTVEVGGVFQLEVNGNAPVCK